MSALTLDDTESIHNERIPPIFVFTRRLVEGHCVKKGMPKSVNVKYPVGKLVFVQNSGGDE